MREHVGINTSARVGNGRIAWIDVAKGIAILLMVIGHMEVGPYVRGLILTFHMPLFMILNGYLIKEYDVRRTFVRSVRTLLVPYFIFGVIQAICCALTSPEVAQALSAFLQALDDMMVGLAKETPCFSRYGSVWLIWFVNCLFLARNLYVMICASTAKLGEIVAKTMRDDQAEPGQGVWSERIVLMTRGILLAVVCLAGYLIGTQYAFLPWNLDVAMYSVVFIAAGDVIHQKEMMEKSGAVMWIVPLIVWGAFVLSKTYIELATRTYPFVIGGAISAIAGSFFWMKCSKWMDDRGSMAADVLAWFGKHSILVLCIHGLEMRFIKWNVIFGRFGESSFSFLTNGVVQAAIRTVLVCICTWVAVLICERIKHKGINKINGEATNE